MIKKRNRFKKSAIATAVLASAIVPTIVVSMVEASETTGEDSYVQIPGYTPTANVAIKDLPKGTTFGFAGQLFVLLNPSTGYVISKEALSGLRAFDTTTNTVFNPTSTTNIAHYLNNTYYNTFTDEEKAAIKTSQWGIGGLSVDESGYGGRTATLTVSQMKAKEDATTVSAKIGLLSTSEYIQDHLHLNDPEDSFWLRTRETTTAQVYEGAMIGATRSGVFNVTNPKYTRDVRPTFYLNTDTQVTIYKVKATPNPATDFHYVVSGGEVTINGYKGTSTDVVVPEKINGYPVTKLGMGAFYNYNSSVITDRYSKVKITSIELPSTLREIGNEAFNLSGITSITIPDSVESIGVKAFHLTDLAEINFSENSNLKTIGADAFYSTDISSINLPDKLTSIGDRAFYYNFDLEHVKFSNSLTTIGADAFYMSGVNELNFPETLVSIGDRAFYSNLRLTKINFPSSLRTIGAEAFKGSNKFYSVNIPSGVTSIGASAFHSTNLKATTVEGMDTTVGNNAFNSNGASKAPQNIFVFAPKGSKAEAYANARSHTFTEIDKTAEPSKLATEDGQATILNLNETKEIDVKPNFSGEVLGYTVGLAVAELNATIDDAAGGILVFNPTKLMDVTKAINNFTDVVAVNRDGSVTVNRMVMGVIEKVNTAPTVVSPIANKTVAVNTTLEVDLAPYFTDADNDTLTYKLTVDNADGEVKMVGSTLNFKGITEGTYTVKVQANDGNKLSEELIFTVEVVGDSTSKLWSFENLTGSTERLKRNITVLGGKAVKDLVLEDIEYSQSEIVLETDLGTVILNPDGEGNTIINIPNGLGDKTTDTRLALEKEGINFLDIKIKAQPKVEFNFSF